MKANTLSPAEAEDFEERAGILEFAGKMPRAAAERRALEIVMSKRNQGNTRTSTRTRERHHGNPGGEF